MKATPKTLFIIFILFVLVIGLYIVFTTVEDFDRSLDPKLLEIKQLSHTIHPQIRHIELYEDDKSYTINKEKIYLCLKDKQGKYYSNNMLTYVFLHEFAHILCDEIGHTNKFKQIFENLLETATEKGIYNPSIPIIDNYCE
jgi:hypothetical protein